MDGRRIEKETDEEQRWALVAAGAALTVALFAAVGLFAFAGRPAVATSAPPRHRCACLLQF